MRRFRTKIGIESHICRVLRREGIAAARRGSCLVTKDAVIVVRNTLNHDAIYQAHKEAVRENKIHDKPEIWIVGQSPTINMRKKNAYATADALSSYSCTVSFIDEDPYWEIGEFGISVREFFLYGGAIAASLLVIVSVSGLFMIHNAKQQPEQVPESFVDTGKNNAPN